MRTLEYETIASISAKLKAGDLTPVELTETMLNRIDELNGQYHAYTHVMHTQARRQAERATNEMRSGQYLGPLHGIPIAVKDLFDVTGAPTTCASTMRQNSKATFDATVVAKLKAAGATILGKLNMTEFALSGYHPDLPVPLNPWNTERWAGVSSSGSAVAAALGLAYGTLGSDTGGSIRYPTAANGVVGIKPTFGTVSKHGAFPLSFSLDHVGPITRCVEDAALMLQVIAGYDPLDPFSKPGPTPNYLEGMKSGITGLRIGIDEAFCGSDAHPEVTQAVLQAAKDLEKLGATLVNVDLLPVLATAPFWGPIVAAEAAVTHSQTYPSRAEDYGPVFKDLLASASSLSASDYAESRLATAQAQSTFNRAFAEADLVLCPSSPVPAMPTAELGPNTILPPEMTTAFVGFTAPMNFTGIPTISLPCGQSSDGLPIGVQLAGPHHHENLLIRAAYAYENGTDFNKIPPLIGNTSTTSI